MDQSLFEVATRIPSMGGMEIGPALRDFARAVRSNTAIVEVGCWLGAGTAQLALGVLENDEPTGIRIHCYDRWAANAAEVEKAQRWGLNLSEGDDLLPHTKRMLQPFAVPIEFHQGDIRSTVWDGGPISLYVDDASKKPKLFYHSLLTFAPMWVPGDTVIFFMDFNIWKTSGDPEHRCQKEFIEAYPKSFEQIHHPGVSSDPEVAVFRYRARADFAGWVLSQVKKERSRLVKSLREREEALRRVKGSASWRITAPLRRARRFLLNARSN